MEDADKLGNAKLVVLTGVNGSGKTRKLMAWQRQTGSPLIRQIGGSGSEIIEFPSSTFAEHEDVILECLNSGKALPGTCKPVATAILNRLEEEGLCPPYTPEQLWCRVPQLKEVNPLWWHNPVVAIGHIVSLDQTRRSRRVTELAGDATALIRHLESNKMSETDMIKELRDRDRRRTLAEDVFQAQEGLFPLELFNNALRSLRAPFEASFSREGDPHLRFTVNGVSIREAVLSDGERMLAFFAGTVVLAEISTQMGHSVDTLLFDEPDRHLDPKLCETMMTAMRQVSDRFRVILTTHRLDTVALAQEEELFEVIPGHCNSSQGTHPENQTTIRSVTRARVACRMAANVPELGVRIRVHVEAGDDVRFYRCLYQRLLSWPCPHAEADRHERQLTQALSTNFQCEELPSRQFQMVFLSKETAGGCTAVAQSIKRELFDADHLAQFGELGSGIFADPCFHQPFGITDRDDGSPPCHDPQLAKRIVQGERYALENYLLDPLFLAFLPAEKLITHIKKPFASTLPSLLTNLKNAVEQSNWQDLEKQVQNFFESLLAQAQPALESQKASLQAFIEKKEKMFDSWRKIDEHGLKERASKEHNRLKNKEIKALKAIKGLLEVMQESQSTAHIPYLFPSELATGTQHNIRVPDWFLKKSLKVLHGAVFSCPLETLIHLFEEAGPKFEEGPKFGPLPCDLLDIFFKLDNLIRKHIMTRPK